MITYLDVQNAAGLPVRFHGDGTPNRLITGAAGLPGVLGFAGPRDSVTNRPSGQGAITRSRWQKAGLVTIEGYVRGATPDAALAQYDVITVPLIDSIDVPALLTWQRGTDGTGVQLQALAQLTDDVNVTEDAAGRVLRYQAHLRLDDPRGYTQALQTAVGGTIATAGGGVIPRIYSRTYDPATGGTVAVNNTGTRPTPPIFHVYGYCTSPQIVLVGAGVRIALTGTVAPGDYIEVDVANRTVKLNGTGSAQGMVDSASTTWFDLPRGTSTLQLLAGANDSIARVDALYRPAYS